MHIYRSLEIYTEEKFFLATSIFLLLDSEGEHMMFTLYYF